MGIGQKLKHIIGNQPIAIILFILLPYYSIAQLSSETLDTLDPLFKNGKYIEYLEKIIKIEKSIKNGENILCQLEELTPLVERPINSNDPEINFQRRKAYIISWL
ncbi:MAG: hypothetical protein IPO85_08415 [Saprospiraceae bacterium]|uniref:Uncharacterized protein n=1 Tax=Candidatus Defluviibacterium haderslevense TaxID=2981993 RepID=A0A9D7XE94_9BACT|nr:hypothetical protein [Candidatus Defluviibacterium haderslevense]